MATTPFDIFPHLPNPPDPMRGSFEELRAWAPAHTRAVADLFRRYQRAVTNVSAVVAAGVPTGGYATAAAEGVEGKFIRSDAVFPFPEALGTLADRTRTLTVTNDAAYSALLTASTAFTTGTASLTESGANAKAISFMAPGGTTPFVITPVGTMGRGVADANTLMRHDSFTVASASRVRGWLMTNLVAGTVAAAPSTGGIIGIEASVTDQPTSASTQVIRGIDFTIKANNANANGAMAVVRATLASYAGTSATRGTAAIFQALAPTTLLNQTLPSLYFYEIAQVPLSSGTISGAIVGLKQTTAFGVGATRRSVQVVNSMEVTANDVILSGAGKRFIAKDGVDGNFYGLSFQNGILMVSNLGATAPTT